MGEPARRRVTEEARTIRVELGYLNRFGQSRSVNAYFVRYGTEAVIIDTGNGTYEHHSRILEEWTNLGQPRVRFILLTHGHSDHSGGARKLAEVFEAPVAIHRLDKPLLTNAVPLVPDDLRTIDSQLNLGAAPITPLHTPGHTNGHVCFLLTGEATLFSGDTVPAVASTLIGRTHGNMAAYLESLRSLLKIQFGTVAPGHGKMVDDGWRRTLDVLEVRLRREGEIVALLRVSPRTAEDIIGVFYGASASSATRTMGLTMVESHLRHLESNGRVSMTDGRWHLGRKSL